MDYNIFSEVLFDAVIYPIIKNEYDFAVDQDARDEYNVSCDCIGNKNAINRYKKKLYSCYSGHNKSLKEKLGMHSTDLLDCHKVGAVLLFSLLDLKPIQFSLELVGKISDIPDEIKLVNYRIAFKAACAIIFVDMIENLKDKGAPEEMRMKLLNNGRVLMPKVRAGLSRYLDNYSKLLYCNDRIGRDLVLTDYLEVADTLFLIELINYKYLDPNREIVE